jgi:carboxyl-terminal processing protease
LTTSIRRQAWRLLGGTCFLALAVSVAAAESAPQARVDRQPGRLAGTLDELQKQAAACEASRDWIEASRCYDEILRRDRNRTDARASFLRCVRHNHLVRRHQDSAYRQALARLNPAQSLDVYEQVLVAVGSKYVDRRKTQWTLLFQYGVQEVRLALDEPVFVREYLADLPPETIAAFAERLEGCRDRKVGSKSEARQQVLTLLEAAQQVGVPLRPLLMTALTLEFAAGACNALDEWTVFLAPGSASEVQSQRSPPSIGVEVAVVDGQVVISRVYPNGPAHFAALMPQDRLVSIGGTVVANLSVEAIAERLRGEDGSIVEVVVQPQGQTATRSVSLTRRSVIIPTVEYYTLAPNDSAPGSELIGLLRISSFQENTLPEVTEALADLRGKGIKGLILDLRGNPGGLFKVAVQVAELFLGEGVVVITQGPHREFNRPYRAESPSPDTSLKMVVLVDSDTASAAEVVAGALKEHRRATLLGETTYGKGSIQVTIPLDRPPLDKMPGGIRITVARLLSPARQPYTGVGITPDILSNTSDEVLLPQARSLLLGIMSRTMAPMPPMPSMSGMTSMPDPS